MTEKDLLKDYGFVNFEEVKLMIRMAFPRWYNRFFVPVYPSATLVIKALEAAKRYLRTESIDVMIAWARGKYKFDENENGK